MSGAPDVATLGAEELDAAVGVLSRGMCDNPVHIAALGDDPEHREQRLSGMFGLLMSTQPDALRATRDGVLVGVCGMAPPGACIGAFAALGPADLPPVSDDPAEQARVAEWLLDWAKRDLAEPHWHLGPVAADRGKQRQGIGSAMLEAYCTHLGREGAVGYLETDKLENVGFYEQFGFETVDEADVLGVPNWFMHRAPK